MQILNRKLQQRQDHLKESFQDGYKKAAIALSEIIHDKINYNNFHHSIHSVEINSISKIPFINRVGANMLTTTEIFGEITGKSYFLLGEFEFEMMTTRIDSEKDISMDIDLKMEFMKELDNILSTSVISKLSEHLALRIYGDTPTWVEPFDGNIIERIHHDFQDGAQDVYINCIYFSLDTNPRIQPFFI